MKIFIFSMQVHNKSSLKTIRQNLRNNPTPSENLLWQQLKGSKLRNKKFRRQHSIGNYIVDFYCPENRLILEIDGQIHNSIDMIEKDKHRDENLKDMHFKILRIPNADIEHNISRVLEKIKNELK